MRWRTSQFKVKLYMIRQIDMVHYVTGKVVLQQYRFSSQNILGLIAGSQKQLNYLSELFVNMIWSAATIQKFGVTYKSPCFPWKHTVYEISLNRKYCHWQG